MTSRARVTAALGAALGLVLAPAGAAGQEFTGVSATWLAETATVDAAPWTESSFARHQARDWSCASPFDVRYGPYWSVYLGGPFGYYPFGYRPFGWYGRFGSRSVGLASSFGPYALSPCGPGFGFYGRGFGWFGRYGGPGWSFWSYDPWIWGYGYNPRLAYGYGYGSKSGWWAPFGYGSAPYGSDREVFEDLMRRRSSPASPPPGRTAEATPVDAGEDGPDVTRFGSAGIRARGADLRKVRPDMPPIVVLGGAPGAPGADAAGRLDPTATARNPAGGLSRETLRDALARSRAEIAARRVELTRESSPGDLARRGLSPARGPEVFARPVEPPRTFGADRSRFGAPRSQAASPGGASSFGRRGAGMGSSAPPRSFASPPRSSPAPAPARSGGNGGRSGGGKTAAPE